MFASAGLIDSDALPDVISDMIVSGFDQILSINDANQETCTISAVHLDNVIGSVRWGVYGQYYITFTVLSHCSILF